MLTVAIDRRMTGGGPKPMKSRAALTRAALTERFFSAL